MFIKLMMCSWTFQASDLYALCIWFLYGKYLLPKNDTTKQHPNAIINFLYQIKGKPFMGYIGLSILDIIWSLQFYSLYNVRDNVKKSS